MRIGVFGGTFDPPHLGHMILAMEAYSQLKLDHLLWVLTPDPPHKRGQEISPIRQRLALSQAALRSEPLFELSRVEIDRPGPHFVSDTMHILNGQYPDDELIYLIGGDSLHDLPNWDRPREFILACHALGVMRRPDDEVNLPWLEEQLPGLTPKLRFIDVPLLEISSKQIRQRISDGMPYRYYLLPQVYTLICKRGYYRQA
ncbi:MAG TPA: nicotinate-nucleotide adenylyltransferase [Anaerolineaceae bacterium]|nr:nicotinate-nucleotide adenylyltransferase [Anaerolineaceae bacterium]